MISDSIRKLARVVFFLGFTSLSENASMCDARAATVASAHAVAPRWTQATGDAWEAVGVTKVLCGS